MYINNSYKIKKRKEIIHLCIYFNYRSVNLYTKIIYMYWLIETDITRFFISFFVPFKEYIVTSCCFKK